MLHSICVFTVSKSTQSGVSSIQRVNSIPMNHGHDIMTKMAATFIYGKTPLNTPFADDLRTWCVVSRMLGLQSVFK